MFIILITEMYGCRPQGSERLCNLPKVVQPVNGGAELRTQQLFPESVLFPVDLTASLNLPNLSFALD